jgi:PAS domain S-box-containing protein
MGELTSRDANYQLLVNAVTDYAIFMLDTEGRIQTWNSGAERIKGYRSEEIIGRHFSIFYTAEDRNRDRPQQGLRMAATDGRFEDEGWRVRSDGLTFWANDVITAVHDEDGRLQGFAKITRDLTERRRNEEVVRALELTEERIRIAEEIRNGTIRELFRLGLDLQAVAGQIEDPKLKARIESSIGDLDHVIVHLRNQVLSGRSAGKRE